MYGLVSTAAVLHVRHGFGPTARRCHMRSDLLIVAFRAAFRPEAAKSVRENYEFRIDDTSFFVKIDDGKIETGLRTAEHPAFILIADAETFDRIAAGSLDVEDAQKRGSVEILGDDEAYERCAKMFSIREPAPELYRQIPFRWRRSATSRVYPCPRALFVISPLDPSFVTRRLRLRGFRPGARQIRLLHGDTHPVSAELV